MNVRLTLGDTLSSFQAVLCTTAGLLFLLTSVHVKFVFLFFLLPSRHQSNQLNVVLCIKFYLNFLSHHSVSVEFVVFSLNNITLGAVALQQWLPTLAFTRNLDFCLRYKMAQQRYSGLRGPKVEAT